MHLTTLDELQLSIPVLVLVSHSLVSVLISVSLCYGLIDIPEGRYVYSHLQVVLYFSWKHFDGFYMFSCNTYYIYDLGKQPLINLG